MRGLAGYAILVAIAFSVRAHAVAPEAGAADPPRTAQTLPQDESTDPSESDIPAARAAAKLRIAKPPYPEEVRRSLERGRKECVAQGGTAMSYGAGTVRTGDLTGDGRPDFIVDFRGSRCAGYLGMFNGTGGWDIEILVAKTRGRVVPVFAGRVLDYDMSDGPGARTMTFRLHGSYCGLFGPDLCVKRRRMNDRRFTYRDR